MNKNILKREKRQRRHMRGRSRMTGTSTSPRVSVFRSNSHISAQLIDDTTGKTLASVTSKGQKLSGTKTEAGSQVGKALAEKALGMKIESVVFDRGGFKYHGRVKALAEAAREAGLKF